MEYGSLAAGLSNRSHRPIHAFVKILKISEWMSAVNRNERVFKSLRQNAVVCQFVTGTVNSVQSYAQSDQTVFGIAAGVACLGFLHCRMSLDMNRPR